MSTYVRNENNDSQTNMFVTLKKKLSRCESSLGSIQTAVLFSCAKIWISNSAADKSFDKTKFCDTFLCTQNQNRFVGLTFSEILLQM
jgi:hypothetical protein